MKKTGLPADLKPYFWDVDFSALDADEKPFFIISRILDRGSTPDVRWVISYYGVDMIRQTIIHVRNMDRSTGWLWSRLLNLDPNEVRVYERPTPRRTGSYTASW
jgi:hypothetical protein